MVVNKWRFYKGVISSFDPVERKHKFVYDDGLVEKLRLHKERWVMREDNSYQKDHGLDFQGHTVSSATSSEKKAKRNSSSGPNISFCLLHLYPVVLHSELNKTSFSVLSPGLKVVQSRRTLNKWKFLLQIEKKLNSWKSMNFHKAMECNYY